MRLCCLFVACHPFRLQCFSATAEHARVHSSACLLFSRRVLRNNRTNLYFECEAVSGSRRPVCVCSCVCAFIASHLISSHLIRSCEHWYHGTILGDIFDRFSALFRVYGQYASMYPVNAREFLRDFQVRTHTHTQTRHLISSHLIALRFPFVFLTFHCSLFKRACLQAYIHACQRDPRCGGQPLMHFLNLPIRRIPQYLKLLQSQQAVTTAFHQDKKPLQARSKLIVVVHTRHKFSNPER